MGKATAVQRGEAIIRRAVQVHEPYKVFKQSKALGFTSKGFCLIYVAPFTGDRQMIMQDISDKATARDLKDLVERAWVEGLRTKLAE
jgi:hypothetical protein